MIYRERKKGPFKCLWRMPNKCLLREEKASSFCKHMLEILLSVIEVRKIPALNLVSEGSVVFGALKKSSLAVFSVYKTD